MCAKTRRPWWLTALPADPCGRSSDWVDQNGSFPEACVGPQCTKFSNHMSFLRSQQHHCKARQLVTYMRRLFVSRGREEDTNPWSLSVATGTLPIGQPGCLVKLALNIWQQHQYRLSESRNANAAGWSVLFQVCVIARLGLACQTHSSLSLLAGGSAA